MRNWLFISFFYYLKWAFNVAIQYLYDWTNECFAVSSSSTDLSAGS